MPDLNDLAREGQPVDLAAGVQPAPKRRRSTPPPPASEPPPSYPTGPTAPTSETVPRVDEDRYATPPDDTHPDDGHHEAPDAGTLAGMWRWYGDQDWSTRPLTPRRWLLTRPRDPGDVNIKNSPEPGYLPRGKVGMIAAAGGAGKTMALLQLAVSVATGQPWLGSRGFNVPEEARGYVCLLLAEEDEDEVQRRMMSIKDALALQGDEWELVCRRLLILPMVGKPSARFIEATGERGKTTRETPFFDDFKTRLVNAGVPWSLIVLDPLSRLATAETEVDNHHATRFVEAVEKLVNVPGEPTVLVAHHSNKSARGGVGAGSANAARGASGLTDGVRWLATLDYPAAEKGEEPQLTLSLAKHNYSAPADPRPLVRGLGGVLNVKPPDVDAAAAQPAAPAPSNGKRPGRKSRSEPPAKIEDEEDPLEGLNVY
jgi:hypothetical protein